MPVLVGVFLFSPKIDTAKAAGNTYYVRADGTVLAANKVNATSPNAAGTSLNMAQAQASTFAAGDQVLFSSQGGGYTETLTLPSGGSGVGTEINYANVLGETPVITSSTGPIIYTNSKSNIKILGFSLIYTGSAATYGVRIHGGSNVTVQNLSVNMGGYGNNIFASISISNVLIDSVTLTNNGAAVPSIYFIGSSNSNITISNSSANTGLGIQIQNTTNLTISNISSTKGLNLTAVTTGTFSTVTVPAGSAAPGLYLLNSSNITVNDFTYAGSTSAFNIGGSNQITINRFTATAGSGSTIGTSNNIIINDSHLSNTSGGFVVGTGAHDITFNNCTVDYSGGDGFLTRNDSYNITYNNCSATNSAVVGFHSIDTSNNVTCNNCKSDHNGSIGFVAQGSASNVTYWYSEASYNGKVNVVFNGAGFLPHDNATNIKCYYCIAHHNYTAGIGDVSTGTNLFYNTIIWANGYAVGDTFNGTVVTTPSTRGNIYMSPNKSAGSVTIKNTISGQGKPHEITNAANSAYTILDYNLYYPIDNSTFFSTDGINNISWSIYHSTNEQHSLNADPLFVNASGLYNTVTDFILTALSPAIDAGFDTSIAMDYAGNARRDDFLVANTGGGALSYYDIGAYEYVAPLSIVPSAPTLSAISTSSINIVINANGNVDTTEYAIENTTISQWVQAGGTLGASEAWQNRTAWGGDLGIASTGLSANTTYAYKVKARNAEHIETALSGLSGHYTLSDIPVLSSLACPSQTTYCLDTTPDITVTNTSPDASYYYLVNQILSPSIATVEAGTADADGTFTVPDGQIHPHATFYIHVIAKNPNGDFSTNYGTFKIISRDSSGSVEPVTTTPESTPVITSTIPTTEEIINEIVNTSRNYYVTPPVASFVVPSASFGSTADNLTGGKISFDATGSTSNKEIVKYEWTFGDGTTSDNIKTDHKYTAPGRYTVTLTVTDSAGNKNTTTQTIDVKPVVPTITNITANGTALWIEGKADPNTTIYFTIHSNLFEGQGLANKDGYWTYFLDNASEVLGEGDHTIVALAAVKLADNTELKGVESKTYDFKMNVDNGKLNVETQKTRVWQIATGIIGSLFILLIIFLVFRRRRA